jgi:hypothetical protein
VANKLQEYMKEETGASSSWLATSIERKVNRSAAEVVMSNIKANARIHKDKTGPPAKAPPFGMTETRGVGSHDPMPHGGRGKGFQDGRQFVENTTGKGRPDFGKQEVGGGVGGTFGTERKSARVLAEENEAEYALAEMPEEVRAHRVDTTKAGMTIREHVTIETSSLFWGNQIRFLRGDVKYAYDMWKNDSERLHTYLATRTLLFQGFVGFYELYGKEFNTIVKGLARHRPDVIVLLVSNNAHGKTLRGSAFVRYRSEIDARHAMTHFNGRKFGSRNLDVKLSTRETQARVGDEKGKMAGGKAVQNDNITLQREDIVDMAERDNVDMAMWGEVDLSRVFVQEYHGEGRKAHFPRN